MGCMIHELVAGRPPFKSSTFMDLIEEKNTFERS